jgi:hypothetical protein
MGGLAYLSLPLVHAIKRAPASVAAVPIVAAARDGAKVLGCLEGLLSSSAEARLDAVVDTPDSAAR